MNRVLAVDYGEKRVGLAWTDALGISINPLETVQTTEFEKTIKNILAGKEVKHVVFGLPSHKDGTLTKVGGKVLEIVRRLAQEFGDISFSTIDESFTSVRAKNLMIQMGTKKKNRRRKENVDQMSAVLILKDYIDSI